MSNHVENMLVNDRLAFDQIDFTDVDGCYRITDEEQPERIYFTHTYNQEAKKFHKMAVGKGFYSLQDDLMNILGDDPYGMPITVRKRLAEPIMELFDPYVKLSRVALIMSELGEMVEAIRKPGESDKIPGFSGLEEEASDVIIRMLDMADWLGLDLDGAIPAKHNYNDSREYKHGKNA